MNDVTNMIWGADTVEKPTIPQEIVDAAGKKFFEEVGREAYSQKELLEYFTQNRSGNSLFDKEWDGRVIGDPDSI